MRTASLVLLVLMAACGSPPATDSHTDSTPLRILAYNIKHGVGMDGKLDLERAAALIRQLDPDIVALQEIDKQCTRSHGIDQAAWLGRACDMHAAFGAFMPYQGGEYGMAILSRKPMLAVENIRLPDGAEPRTALAARIATAAGEIIVTSIHLYATEEERLAQAETLITHFRDESLPVILIGDFNSQPGTPVMDRLAESWAIVQKTGANNTFPADEPDREIDFGLVRPSNRTLDPTLRVIEEPLTSDHRPILLEFRLRPNL